MEYSTEITEPQQEFKAPEYNRISKGERLLYGFKKITHKSKTSGINRMDRSIDLRSNRADLYKKAIDTDDPKTRKELFGQAHSRDAIEQQYLMQGEVKVNLPGLGEQIARYNMIEPPEGRRTSETDSKPTIILIPGISNDIDSVGNLEKEIPFNGRNIITIAMPDSFMGLVTEEFATAVKNVPDMTLHTEFFKNAINALAGNETPIELWGHSTGAMIVAKLLNDPQFSERTTNAVLTSPAGSTEQSKLSSIWGNLGPEVVRLLKSGETAKYSFTGGRKEDLPQQDAQTAKNRVRTFNAVIEKTIHRSSDYDTMKVKEGGKIIVVSGDKDQVTKSRKSIEEFGQNPQAEVLSLPNGIHSTPITKAQVIVPEIFAKQQIGKN